jgi:outer membrane receptor for ferrienterochelin and colicins
MKRFFLMIFCFTSALYAISQEKTDAMLFGDVKSAATGMHIPFSTVMIKGTQSGTTTDGSGHYKIANLPLGKNIVVAQAMGYKTQEKEVFLEKGKAMDLFFELEDDILNLDQLVITGTRTQHYVKDVPLRTLVITLMDIESKNACNLYQALEGTPGVRVENQCQSCNFTMVRMQGLGAEHTQILINGQPMYSGLAGVYGLQQLSTIDVARIEVVKGAGSALYGSSAVAGAINIVTKEPSGEPETTLDLQFGRHGTNKYDLSSSLRNEKGNLGLNVFAQRYSEGAIDETGAGWNRNEVRKKDGISDRVSTSLTNAGFSLYINNALTKNDKLIFRGKSVFEKRQGGIMTDDYFKNPFTDGTENITTDRYEAGMSYKKLFKDQSEINLSVAYVKHDRDATNDSYLGDFMETHHDSVPDVRDMRPYLAEENSVTSTLSYGKKIKTHSLLIGLQSFYDELSESGMYVIVDPKSNYYGSSYRSTASKYAREFGLFFQDEWAVNEKLMVVPGLRLDNHHSGEEYSTDRQVSDLLSFPKTEFDETSINPRIAVKYKISEKYIVRANMGSGRPMDSRKTFIYAVAHPGFGNHRNLNQKLL